jgi:uncharacterized protein (TIGR03032 family)
MSAIVSLSRNQPGPDGAPQAPPAPVEFHYEQSESFVAMLHQLRASLLVSTYQANKLLAVRAAGNGLSTLVRTFDRPMGMAVDSGRLALGTRKEVWFLRDAPDIAPRIEPTGHHDACFLPRSCHVTGDISVHEMAWAGEELWIVNTRFSCLCTLHTDYSFAPRWRPPFITALAAEDRCHLNGLALVDSMPRYVTALGSTDVRDGWRAGKPHGGCLMDVPSGAFVTRGLSMPHSPRWHDGRLWLLESGTGQLVLVDPATGSRQKVAELPGFARGLALYGPYAFVGLSKIRKTSAMDGSGRATRPVEMRRGSRGLAQRQGHRHVGVPDGRGRDLRRATVAWPALSGGDRLPAGDDPEYVCRSTCTTSLLKPLRHLLGFLQFGARQVGRDQGNIHLFGPTE